MELDFFRIPRRLPLRPHVPQVADRPRQVPPAGRRTSGVENLRQERCREPLGRHP